VSRLVVVVVVVVSYSVSTAIIFLENISALYPWVLVPGVARKTAQSTSPRMTGATLSANTVVATLIVIKEQNNVSDIH